MILPVEGRHGCNLIRKICGIRKLHDQPKTAKAPLEGGAFQEPNSKKIYNADSISKPQASKSASGMYLEFLLRRAHSRRRVERIY